MFIRVESETVLEVTVELYGEQLMHLEHHKHREGVMEVRFPATWPLVLDSHVDE